MKLVASPYFDNPQLVVTFLDAIQSIDYGKGSVESIAEEFVITSYSIHYTKLYDMNSSIKNRIAV